MFPTCSLLLEGRCVSVCVWVRACMHLCILLTIFWFRLVIFLYLIIVFFQTVCFQFSFMIKSNQIYSPEFWCFLKGELVHQYFMPNHLKQRERFMFGFSTKIKIKTNNYLKYLHCLDYCRHIYYDIHISNVLWSSLLQVISGDTNTNLENQ